MEPPRVCERPRRWRNAIGVLNLFDPHQDVAQQAYTRFVADGRSPQILQLTPILSPSLGVPANRITAIIKGQRSITGDTAVRLAAFFNTTAEFWMNLQKTYELRLAEQALPGKVRKHIEQSREALISA